MTEFIIDRRLSTPEYRERVHRRAEQVVSMFSGDYDAAADYAEMLKRSRMRVDDLTQFRHDVAALLRRRADTLAGRS